MESTRTSAGTPNKIKIARTLAKVLNVRAVSGIAPVNANLKDIEDMDKSTFNRSDESLNKDDEELHKRVATRALLAKVFASISTVKASYAQLQHAESPYDPDGVQTADQLVVSELQTLSQLKQCYLKKQFDSSPEMAILEAESKELQSVKKAYEIMGKKLESQARLKESEIIFLREKLDEANRENKSIEKSLTQSGSLSVLDINLHMPGLNPSHFITVLHHTVRSIRSFVKLIVNEMRSAGWDIDAAVNAIGQNVFYWKDDHKCFAIESFVCREMFDSFNYPNFSLPNESLPPDRNKRQQLFFGRFNELKSVKAQEILAEKPRSAFAKFCRIKYLKLVHPNMESSFFGNLNQRNLSNGGEFPDTNLFTSFAEMSKRVWLLHCLSFTFEPQASIFLVDKGCRFSDVYMETVTDDEMPVESEPQEVAFTVVPGFKIGKTVIQCQVYLSQEQTNVEKFTSQSGW